MSVEVLGSQGVPGEDGGARAAWARPCPHSPGRRAAMVRGRRARADARRMPQRLHRRCGGSQGGVLGHPQQRLQL